MAKNKNHLVIMAGGIGSRFWPMSTNEMPKQFIDVLGTGKSLLQMTVERFAGICDIENTWIVTNKNYTDIVREQLPELPSNHILCEPCRRNTAPCIAYVSWRIKSVDPKANIVVSPSDHIVTNNVEFQRVIKSCLNFTAETDSIVTLGMKPTRPETGYGYIQADLSVSSMRNKEIFRVDSFREKPDLETAKMYITKNNYFWNSGIFLSSMPSGSISPSCPECLSLCSTFTEPTGNKRKSTACFPPAKASLSIMPLWKRRKRSSFAQQTSAGATSAHGARCSP